MEIRVIDNPLPMLDMLNDPLNTGNIVSAGDVYDIKPDAIYVGVYEDDSLIGIHEVRCFWKRVVECHAIYHHQCRGRTAFKGHKLFCQWLLANSQFTNSITMVPDNTKYGRVIIGMLGASRIGHLDDAYMLDGHPMGVTLYQLKRSQYEELAK
ncbi:MAG: DUF2824 family protein [Mesorhizobium sp.]|nr:MAG: DUF2824 family protein [Mesorhizobium sp.]